MENDSTIGENITRMTTYIRKETQKIMDGQQMFIVHLSYKKGRVYAINYEDKYLCLLKHNRQPDGTSKLYTELDL